MTANLPYVLIIILKFFIFPLIKILYAPVLLLHICFHLLLLFLFYLRDMHRVGRILGIIVCGNSRKRISVNYLEPQEIFKLFKKKKNVCLLLSYIIFFMIIWVEYRGHRWSRTLKHIYFKLIFWPVIVFYNKLLTDSTVKFIMSINQINNWLFFNKW